jgi:hypothetical protein
MITQGSDTEQNQRRILADKGRKLAERTPQNQKVAVRDSACGAAAFGQTGDRLEHSPSLDCFIGHAIRKSSCQVTYQQSRRRLW